MGTLDQEEKRFLVVDPSTGRPEAYIMGCDLRDAEIAVASLGIVFLFLSPIPLYYMMLLWASADVDNFSNKCFF